MQRTNDKCRETSVTKKALSVSEKWENKELKFYIMHVGLEK
jgi:hypothetical protein